MQVTTSGASGFESAIQNVGEIRNNGVEVMVNAVPVHTKALTGILHSISLITAVM